MLLQSQVEQDAHALDARSKKRLQKLANAAQVSFAECALLLNENQLLFQQNNESKRRKSTKSTVVGKAKVMSYDDIVEAQAKRAAKEAAKEAATIKEKCSRKRKGPGPAGATAKKARKSEAEAAKDEIAAAGMRLPQQGWGATALSSNFNIYLFCKRNTHVVLVIRYYTVGN